MLGLRIRLGDRVELSPSTSSSFGELFVGGKSGEFWNEKGASRRGRLAPEKGGRHHGGAGLFLEVERHAQHEAARIDDAVGVPGWVRI